MANELLRWKKRHADVEGYPHAQDHHTGEYSANEQDADGGLDNARGKYELIVCEPLHAKEAAHEVEVGVLPQELRPERRVPDLLIEARRNDRQTADDPQGGDCAS